MELEQHTFICQLVLCWHVHQDKAAELGETRLLDPFQGRTRDMPEMVYCVNGIRARTVRFSSDNTPYQCISVVMPSHKSCRTQGLVMHSMCSTAVSTCRASGSVASLSCTAGIMLRDVTCLQLVLP